MAKTINKERVANYKFSCSLVYIDNKNDRSIDIDNTMIKSIMIQHDYEKLNMPIILLTMALDKSFVDELVKNININYFSFTIWKFNELDENRLKIKYFEEQFTYFLSESLNANDFIDYQNLDQIMSSMNKKSIAIGLMPIKYINYNKKSISMNIRNATVYDCAKYITSHIDNIFIEPFNYNEYHEQIIIPSIDSVSKSLAYLNSNNTFYTTVFRYYIDFDCAYLISSSGKGAVKKDDKFESVTIDIQEITEDATNDPGIIINRDKGNHRIVVNYAKTKVDYNSSVNKSRTELKVYSTSGSEKIQLKNATSEINNAKIKSIRVFDQHAAENLKRDYESRYVFTTISKDGMDPSVLTINKRYSINHIDRYREYDGEYLLVKKIESYIRQGEDYYTCNTTLVLRKAN